MKSTDCFINLITAIKRQTNSVTMNIAAGQRFTPSDGASGRSEKAPADVPMMLFGSPGDVDQSLHEVQIDEAELQMLEEEFSDLGDFRYYNTLEPLLRGHPDERPSPLERPLDTVNLNINVLISTPDERPPLLKGHFSSSKGVASQEGFHCTPRFRLLDNYKLCAHIFSGSALVGLDGLI